MDLATLAPSRIAAVARAAHARPGIEFLCFGESDQPAPAGAAPALAAAPAREDALYPDVRGVPALRQALADYLTRLHAPAWPNPANAALLRGAAVDALPLDGVAGLNDARLAGPPGAFCAFIGVDGLEESLGLALRLVREHGVAVAPGSAFGEGGEGYLRLCFAQRPERMERAVHRLREGVRAR